MLSLHRCPKSWLASEVASENQFVQDYGWLRNHGQTPEPGGMLDQSPRFVEAARLIGSEVDYWESQADGRRADKWRKSKAAFW